MPLMNLDSALTVGHDRRRFLAYFSAIGLGGTLFPGVLWARATAGEEITIATIATMVISGRLMAKSEIIMVSSSYPTARSL